MLLQRCSTARLLAFMMIIVMIAGAETTVLHAQTAPLPLQTIAVARQQPFGMPVRVAGRVTVANELGGPSYIQDSTGGMAVFNADFSRAIQLGDSVDVTGPLAEFQPTTGVPRSGLTQISGIGTTWRVLPVPRFIPLPREISITGMNEANESVLVRFVGVTFRETGAFAAAANYTVSDGITTTTAQVRINTPLNAANAAIPSGARAITGVVGQFRGTYQITPRTLADIGIVRSQNPNDTVPKASTLDLVTWNLKWFGQPRDGGGAVLGPADSLLQRRNVIRVLDSLDADVYALQEVSNAPLFLSILDSLPRYGGVVALGIQPPQPQFAPQRTAFLFKKSVIDTVKSELVLTNTLFAAGRFPFRLTFNATLQGVKRQFTAFVIHAKAGSTQRDYDLRTTDGELLYNFLNSSYPTQNLILLGDFNDSPVASIVRDSVSGSARPTPYLPFVSDTARYTFATAGLARQGLSSFASGSFIDNVVVSNEVAPALLFGTERVESPFTYIPLYTQTTTDHFPVSVRVRIQQVLDVATAVRLSPQIPAEMLSVFPNPATDDVPVSLELTAPESGDALMTVCDALGRTVWESRAAATRGEKIVHKLRFGDVAHGVYIYRVVLNNYRASKIFVIR
jgi:endonuclease/exonuclease/phosphatase family metal-dependent hydrolase